MPQRTFEKILNSFSKLSDIHTEERAPNPNYIILSIFTGLCGKKTSIIFIFAHKESNIQTTEMNDKYSLPKDGGLITRDIPEDLLHRYEKIPVTIFEHEQSAMLYVADIVCESIKAHENEYKGSKPFVLGLSTGKTPIGLYRELVNRYERGEIDFRNVVVYSLDEFYPIQKESMQCRNYYIRYEFLNLVNIKPENIHIPNGGINPGDVTKYCERFDKSCNIDLMLMGTGQNGQIGFNEPGAYEKSRTRLVQLSHNTKKTQSIFFSGMDRTPDMAITMGIETILRSQRIILMAWGEEKTDITKSIVEGDATNQKPATLLQRHDNIEVVVDESAAGKLTRIATPWLVGKCDWTPKFMRRAVVWLCSEVQKPILKLTHNDYIEHSLGDLLEAKGPYDKINIDVFNDLQHTITGWPGGKPNVNDIFRPVPSTPFPKTVLIFSPHPDDDVISMGGTFIRLVEHKHNVHVAYETSGDLAVTDDVVLQHLDTVREIGLGDRYDEVKNIIASKKKGDSEPRALLDLKAGIRRAEAKAAVRSFGLDESHVHFLNLPFYETGSIKKGALTDADIEIIVNILREIKPHQIYAAGDLADPHGTHRICIEAVLAALNIVKDDEWLKECHMWLYRGAWMEWDLGMVDMAVPLSPDEMLKKRYAIYRHLSQKDIVPFPGSDNREFWQRAEERTQNTARLYDKLGMAEYQALEVFVKMF